MKGKDMVDLVIDLAIDLATHSLESAGPEAQDVAVADLAIMAAAELHNARVARREAELACRVMEELAEAVRRDHLAFVRVTRNFKRLPTFQPMLRQVSSAAAPQFFGG